ncbi:MAG: response regulator [Deltaproteobacteria bacterium]|nr:response regulator [Deltaproteobacteria bacterium]
MTDSSELHAGSDFPRMLPLRRVLVVDDDERFRPRLARALARRCGEVRQAGGVQEALAVAAEWQPTAAVVDLRMGDGSGADLVARLVADLPGLRAVILTGYGSIATALDAVRRGAWHYLSKPATADAVLAALTGPRAAPLGDETPAPSLERVEWEHIQRVMTDTGGNVSEAARRLGLHRRSLQRKLARNPPAG